MRKIQETKSKFVRIKCPKCHNEQNVFSNVSTKVTCLVCEKEVLAEPTGGKSKFHGQVIEVIN